MFIQKINKKTETKTYTSTVLMENFREGKKVKHRIISNLSKWPDELVSNLDKLLKGEAVEDVFNLTDFTEYSLYDNLDWLSKNQQAIERKIYKHRTKGKPIKEVYLYDVTSSYLEGDKNELAAYGYNRDKKKGKKQIVIGLLTDSEGYPVSVEVFEGNTSDTKTVSSQLQKLKDNFGVERVIFVGDKGMVKSAQIAEITSDEYKWNYLTTITKQQIRGLLKENLDAQTAHDRYKDLGKVEFAFGTMKTTLEKIRPIFVRKEERTRGHVFVAMLAHMIVKYITDELEDLDYTREFVIESLDKIHYMTYQYKDRTIKIVPRNLLEHQKQIIKGLGLKLKL